MCVHTGNLHALFAQDGGQAATPMSNDDAPGMRFLFVQTNTYIKLHTHIHICRHSRHTHTTLPTLAKLLQSACECVKLECESTECVSLCECMYLCMFVCVCVSVCALWRSGAKGNWQLAAGE